MASSSKHVSDRNASASRSPGFAVVASEAKWVRSSVQVMIFVSMLAGGRGGWVAQEEGEGGDATGEGSRLGVLGAQVDWEAMKRMSVLGRQRWSGKSSEGVGARCHERRRNWERLRGWSG